MPLCQALAIGVGNQRAVVKRRRLQAKLTIDKQLAGGTLEQILAANDLEPPLDERRLARIESIGIDGAGRCGQANGGPWGNRARSNPLRQGLQNSWSKRDGAAGAPMGAPS